MRRPVKGASGKGYRKGSEIRHILLSLGPWVFRAHGFRIGGWFGSLEFLGSQIDGL